MISIVCFCLFTTIFKYLSCQKKYKKIVSCLHGKADTTVLKCWRVFLIFVVFKLYLFYNDYETSYTTNINPARWHRCSRYHYASQDSLVQSCHLNVHIQLQTIIKVHNMLLHHSKLLVLLLIYNDARCVTIILPFVRTSHSFQS